MTETAHSKLRIAFVIMVVGHEVITNSVAFSTDGANLLYCSRPAYTEEMGSSTFSAADWTRKASGPQVSLV